jgi:hypothetical protein
MSIEEKSKYPHEIKLAAYYEPCKGEECTDFCLNCSDDDSPVCRCDSWQAGCCLKTVKPEHKLISIDELNFRIAEKEVQIQMLSQQIAEVNEALNVLEAELLDQTFECYGNYLIAKPDWAAALKPLRIALNGNKEKSEDEQK